MFGRFTRRSEDAQRLKREAEDRARRARFESDSAGIGSSYSWPLGISGDGGHVAHSADCSSSDSGSSSSDGGSCGGGD